MEKGKVKSNFQTGRLIIGILSIVLSFAVLLQSCAAGIYNALSTNNESSGSAGFLLALCAIIAGIVLLCTKKKSAASAFIVPSVIYFFGSYISALLAGSYSDLKIWAVLFSIFGAINIYFLFTLKNKNAFIRFIIPIVLVLITFMFNTASENTKDASNDTTSKVSVNNDTGSTSLNDKTDSTEKAETTDPAEEEKFKIGDTWVVDGQWKLTIDSVEELEDRNEFSDKNPAHIFIINYTYENIGLSSDLYLDLSMSKIIDQNGYMGYSYPGEITDYPQAAPINAKCKAQACVGIDNDSSMITLIVEQYDSNFDNKSATFELNLK